MSSEEPLSHPPRLVVGALSLGDALVASGAMLFATTVTPVAHGGASLAGLVFLAVGALIAFVAPRRVRRDTSSRSLAEVSESREVRGALTPAVLYWLVDLALLVGGLWIAIVTGEIIVPAIAVFVLAGVWSLLAEGWLRSRVNAGSGADVVLARPAAFRVYTT